MRPNIKAVPGKAWLTLVSRFYLIRFGVEVLPDEALLVLVWNLCLMRPSWRWYKDSA